MLIGYHSSAPDGFQVAAYAATKTTRLKFLLAHRPGFVAPTLAARQLATLDQFSDGRLAVHIITGGSDDEQARDGDFLTKEQRYARTDDYIDVLKKTWTSTVPFDHEGPYYTVKDSFAAVKPLQQPHLPVFFGGASDEAIRVAGKHADVYALFGETLAGVGETLAKVRASAAAHGRQDRIGFSLSLRPILGRTEEEAWNRAQRILTDAKALKERGTVSLFRAAKNESTGSQRLQQTARRRRDPRQATVDRDRQADRRPGQFDLAGRHARTGGRRAARLLRPGHHQVPVPRLRSARRCHRLRPQPAAAAARGGRETRAPTHRCDRLTAMAMSVVAPFFSANNLARLRLLVVGFAELVDATNDEQTILDRGTALLSELVAARRLAACGVRTTRPGPLPAIPASLRRPRALLGGQLRVGARTGHTRARSPSVGAGRGAARLRAE